MAYFYLHSTHMIEWISYPILSGCRTFVFSIGDCSLFLLLLHLFNLQGNRQLLRWTWAAVAVHLGFGLADAVVLLDWGDAGPTTQWLNAVVTAVWALSQLMVFVLVYQGLKRKLDLPRNLVAVTAFLLYLWDFVRVVSSQGIRFTHWGLHDRITGPLFHFAGAEITSGQILETLLLISLAYALMRYAVEQRKHEEALELEFKSAKEVQQVLIPEALPEVGGYAIQSVYQPALEVGGDFFQIIPLKDESALVVLGDVSGKGLKAAMNVALIVGTVRTLAEYDSDPAAVLTGLNRRLVGRMQGGFATTIVLKLGTSGHCSLANAGHLPPFSISNEMPLDPSLPLGIVAEADYVSRYVVLSDDDRMTLYTDGVLEACNSARELYGFERVKTLLTKRPDASTIAETARAFGQEDDITVLTITRLPVIQIVEATSVGVATS
ncbi:PP2C family protein-serine/threonine phosphatase [Tunturiibacter gelidiferens]|uniref:PP2C family protein-serine/threonine phosphatase n=1 Tax=Tunturiibacter gelidiferens TaxID=3069689 RepID=UPI003D9AD189